MILVDTPIWIDHLRAGHPTLSRLLGDGLVLGHPWVVGELSLGSLSRREEILSLLRGLPQAELADTDELSAFIEANPLPGAGIGYVDAQLLAATRLTPGARLWTRDRRLNSAAERLGLRTNPT